MMETATQPRSLKLTIKLKKDKSIINSSTTAGHLNNVEGEPNASNSSNLPGSLTTSPRDHVDCSSAEGVENHSTEDERNPSSENSKYQLVLYDPSVNDAGTTEKEPDPIDYQRPLQRPHPFSNQTPRVLPSIGAFTVQCANCFKWRLIPTKEKYEEIREHIMEQPFLCETAREWRPDISCDDPPDITQDGSRLWAIDKPSIAQPPPGWQRLLRIRGEGSTKFADVYYVAPSGKRLRSMVEIERYINEHPEYIEQGVSLSQFSFQIPRPLQENYVRKRPARATPPNDANDLGMRRYLPPSEGHAILGCGVGNGFSSDFGFGWFSFGEFLEISRGNAFGECELCLVIFLEETFSSVDPIAWVGPDVDTELQLSGPGLSTDYSEGPCSNLEIQSAKKKKTPPKRKSNGDLVYNHNDVNVEEPHLL
ncbi:UNVERIFIED_CONTAM: Methyl-CpG-binding domain-containing protein 2 [Sesamum latifolium]|uniref:Methyl-CpG-binding domain-containing protein 2 n=1 Tax=Sesamum latifolium TaxID=2727402 RepID=A0AAW2U3S6_9LAMI